MREGTQLRLTPPGPRRRTLLRAPSHRTGALPSGGRQLRQLDVRVFREHRLQPGWWPLLSSLLLSALPYPALPCLPSSSRARGEDRLECVAAVRVACVTAPPRLVSWSCIGWTATSCIQCIAKIFNVIINLIISLVADRREKKSRRATKEMARRCRLDRVTLDLQSRSPGRWCATKETAL